MSSQVMCKCHRCQKPTVAIKTGMSFGAHLVNWVLVVLTGLLWVIPYLIIWACSGKVLCTVCGSHCKQI